MAPVAAQTYLESVLVGAVVLGDNKADHRRALLSSNYWSSFLLFPFCWISCFRPSWSARGKAMTTVCQNNVRQLGFALRHRIHTTKRFPQPGRWTVDVLKYIEEVPLSEELSGTIPENAEYSRPGRFAARPSLTLRAPFRTSASVITC